MSAQIGEQRQRLRLVRRLGRCRGGAVLAGAGALALVVGALGGRLDAVDHGLHVLAVLAHTTVQDGRLSVGQLV